MKKTSPKSSKNLIIFVLIILFLLVFGRLLYTAATYLPVLYQLVSKPGEIVIKKVKPHPTTVNLLLLGIGGGTHDGPNLTDTIIFASIDEAKNKITLVSIPRDLWVPELAAKVNTAYAYGEEKEKGGGLKLSKAVITKILNQPIDYGFRIDFAGFTKSVDLIGGMDINVDRMLDDYEYPIEGKEDDPCGHKEEELEALATSSAQLEAFPCRYVHFHVDPGLQHMDGETALRYVRSRHAMGVEGTDFARSQRQAKVITAFRNKVLSAETLLNPIKIMSLYDTMQANIDTDVPKDSFDDFIKLFQKMKGAKIQSMVLDLGDESTNRPGLLAVPTDATEYKNQWALIPRTGNGNFAEIQKYIDCEIKTGNCLATPVPSAIK